MSDFPETRRVWSRLTSDLRWLIANQLVEWAEAISPGYLADQVKGGLSDYVIIPKAPEDRGEFQPRTEEAG